MLLPLRTLASAAVPVRASGLLDDELAGLKSELCADAARSAAALRSFVRKVRPWVIVSG